MKIIRLFLLVLLGIAFSCSSQEVLHREKYKGQDILVGKGNFRALETAPFVKWFKSNAGAYRPDNQIIRALKNKIQEVDFEIYMGTWCPDSREQVPAFYKILNEAGYNTDKVPIYFLPRHYDANPMVKGKNIIRVPTIIVKKDGKEIGRIIEYPMETLEKDLLKIVNGQGYKHELSQ